jgi:hypothetical protein
LVVGPKILLYNEWFLLENHYLQAF